MLLCYNFVFNSVFYRDDAVMVCLGLGIKNALLGFRRAHVLVQNTCFCHQVAGSETSCDTLLVEVSVRVWFTARDANERLH